VKGNELGVMVVGWSVESTVEIYFLPSSNSCLVYRVGSRYSSFPPLHRRNPGRGLFCYTGSTEPSLSAGRSHTELTIVWHLLRARTAMRQHCILILDVFEEPLEQDGTLNDSDWAGQYL